MSLVTRCPACATTFKVVRDQLRISDGWVRCGRCSHVFDATLDLHEAPDGVPGPAAPPPPPTAPSAKAEAESGPSEQQHPSQAGQAGPESSSATEDADFFDDEPEHGEASDAVASSPLEETDELLPPAPLPETRPAPTPAPSSAPATPSATAFVLPAHGIIADELWSDFEANEPEWRPPASSLPPFPNIDLNLAAPPSPPPPPPPPLPALRIKAREMAASASVEDEKHEAAQDRDQVQMQKALRRARIKSAKIASAKARDERTAAKASASMVRQASELDGLDGDSGPLPLPAPLHEAEDSDRVPFSGDEKADRGTEGFWQRGVVRFALWFFAVLAVVLFVAQVLHHERNGIVARQPNLRPAFAAMCRLTGCELTALRQIGDIVIEGAAFAREKTGNNDYRLSFTLRNGATVPLAMPAIELSLLDTQERAVVRRVLAASDYGAPTVLAARSDQAASLPLTLSATEAATLPPIAGYRVEAFYP